jgi:hypothetical protein
MGMEIEVRFADNTGSGSPGNGELTYFAGEIAPYPDSRDCWRRTTERDKFNGKKVAQSKWGKVCHHIIFTDGDTREYTMCSKNFNILRMPRRRIALGVRPPQLRPVGGGGTTDGGSDASVSHGVDGRVLQDPSRQLPRDVVLLANSSAFEVLAVATRQVSAPLLLPLLLRCAAPP